MITTGRARSSSKRRTCFYAIGFLQARCAIEVGRWANTLFSANYIRYMRQRDYTLSDARSLDAGRDANRRQRLCQGQAMRN